MSVILDIYVLFIFSDFMKITPNRINFLWLIGSSILVKLLGVARESVAAYYIGTTIEFAYFNLLRTAMELVLSVFVGVQLLEGIIIPQYTPIYRKYPHLSFLPLMDSSKKLSFICFGVMFFLLSGITLSGNFTLTINHCLFIIGISLWISLSAYNSVYFIIQKVIGNFKKYSQQLFILYLLFFLIQVILIPFLGITSILLSSIVSILISNQLLKVNIKISSDTNDKVPSLQWKLFNLPSLLAINHPILIGFIGKLLIGLNESPDINYYHYAFMLVYSFMTAIVYNLSSITLYQASQSSILNSLKKPFILMCCFIISMNIVLYFFGELIVRLLFERGKFTSIDTNNTYLFILKMLVPFSLLSLSQLFLQPILNKRELSRKVCVIISSLLIISILSSIIYLLIIRNYENSLTMFLYCSSTSILIYLCFILLKTFQQDKKNIVLTSEIYNA